MSSYAWDLISRLNGSPVALAVANVASSFGSRYVLSGLTPAQEAALNHPVVKRVVLACMLFVVTRDVLLSISIAAIVLVFVEALANEQSRFSVTTFLRAHQPTLARFWTKAAPLSSSPRLERMTVLPDSEEDPHARKRTRVSRRASGVRR